MHGEALAAVFEAERTHLRAVAYRMLGSVPEADDAVQEAWLKASRADLSAVDNLPAWLTTVTSRVAIDLLRARTSRREDLDAERPDALVASPEAEAALADSVGEALTVVLDELAPAERLSFVLHDLFALSYDEIAPLVDRTPAAARQLASRARRRVQGGTPDRAPDREVVNAFLDASRNGNFEALLELLDPDVVLRMDSPTPVMGGVARMHGAAAVAENFHGKAKAARSALIDGAVGATWSHLGEVRAVFEFVVRDQAVASIEVITDPETIASMQIEALPILR